METGLCLIKWPVSRELTRHSSRTLVSNVLGLVIRTVVSYAGGVRFDSGLEGRLS
jgi:hypothetical protein